MKPRKDLLEVRLSKLDILSGEKYSLKIVCVFYTAIPFPGLFPIIMRVTRLLSDLSKMSFGPLTTFQIFWKQDKGKGGNLSPYCLLDKMKVMSELIR